MTAPYLLLLATLTPLASFLILIFFGRKFGRASAYVATGAIGGSFGLSVLALVAWANKLNMVAGGRLGEGLPKGVREAVTYPWINFGGDRVLEVGMLVDTLTVTMFVMVTAVATLVHIFSIGYLAGDKRFSRFFAYLGLFCFSMLGLVLSDSLLQLFVFWELVGVCSYLLIGFWFEKRGPAMASKKAMVTNRIGDAGFLIGMGLILMQLGPGALTLERKGEHIGGDGAMAGMVRQAAESAQTVTPALGVPHEPTVPAAFAEIASEGKGQEGHGAMPEGEVRKAGDKEEAAAARAKAEAPQLVRAFGPRFFGISWLTLAGVCLFMGAAAKSAQFPLHVWLPDAMEGPTPVSALIHAATMVAAGVYLVARIFPILTVDARLVVAVVGCTTLVMAALIAVVMTDIKKILAYSTISQLGFMILFLGMGCYVGGLFHLITHAFFKACLFLGSGSVIAACHHEQEVTKMGGLWRKIPVTALTFGVSVLAIAGTPFFSGYYSKDLGLAAVYESAHQLAHVNHNQAYMLLFWIPTATAYLTSFYMWRCWVLTFGGKPRDLHVYEHASEQPVMTLPLIVLGVMAVISGYEWMTIQRLIESSEPAGSLAVHTGPESHGTHAVHQYVWYAFIVGPVLAAAIYWRGFWIADRVRRVPGISLIYVWLKNKMFFDHLYEGVIVGLCKGAAFTLGAFDKYVVDGLVNLGGHATRGVSWMSGMVDRWIVDGAVNGAALAAQGAGAALRWPQTGRVRFYVLSTVTVLAVVVVGVGVWVVLRS